MALTPKERFFRGFDALGSALPDFVHPRMQEVAGDRPWFPIHQALEEKRGRFTRNLDPTDPREMLTVLRRYEHAFPEVTEGGQRDIRRLARFVNSAVHSVHVSEEQAEQGLATCLAVAQMLGLAEVAAQIQVVQQDEAAAVSGGDVLESGVAPSTDETVPGPVETSGVVPNVVTQVNVQDDIGTVTFKADEYAVRVNFLEALNFALTHNSVNLLHEVTVENLGDTPLNQITLTLTLVGASSEEADGFREKTVAIPTIPGRSTHVVEVKDLLWPLPDSLFGTATEAWNIDLRVSIAVAGEMQGADSAPLVVHPANEWWMANTGEALASFIRPNEDVISQLLSRVSDHLHDDTGDAALHGYQRGPERVRATARAAYQVLLESSIDYVEAPPSFRAGSQRIRGHAEVLEKRLGTCLDLAVLYAALLEAAGIAPVVILGKDHAFTGYLLEDTQLSESFLTAPAAIDTVSQSDMFESVELTGVTSRDRALTFAEARSTADRWWPNRIDEVDGFIDIRAAHRWFKPLPTLIERDGVLVIEKIVQAPVEKHVRDAESVSYSRVEETVPQRVTRWKKSLLDLSFRNPLLKIKRPSSIQLLLPAKGVGLLEDRVSADHTIGLKSDTVIRAHQQLRLDLNDPSVQESLLQELTQGDNTFTDLSDSILQRRVTSLRRRAKEAREETGADSLYLALGILEWREGATTGAAPVFLLPISLRGGKKGEAITFVFDYSREFEPNYCLFEKLKGTYNIELPELLDPGEDLSGLNVEGAFSHIRTRLMKAGTTQFRLQEHAYLSTFQFSTLTMWRDLDENWDRLTQSAPVRHLVENTGDNSQLGLPTDVDATRLSETDAYAPLPVDSAQLAAIDLAAQGASFVLEGPPGTGKSQTITNMIAHALAQGQKVLFVAEKQAALEVVQRRLKGVGLSDFILELHGEQQTRSSVREHLQASLDAEQVRAKDFRRSERTFKRAVTYLNDYARKLHTEGTSGQSLWTAHQAVLNTADIGNPHGEPVEISRRRVTKERAAEHLQAQASKLESAMLALDGLPMDSAWVIMDRTFRPTEADGKQVKVAAAALAELFTQLPVAHVDLVLSADSRASGEAVLQWFEARIHTLAVDPAQAAQAEQQWLGALKDGMDELASFVESNSPTALGFVEGILGLDLDRLHAQSVDADEKMFRKAKKRAAIMEELQPMVAGAALQPESLTRQIGQLISLRDYALRWRHHLAANTGISVDDSFSIYDAEAISDLRGQILGWEVSAELGEVLLRQPNLQQLIEALGDVSTEDLALLKEFTAAWWDFREAAGVTATSLSTWADGRSLRAALSDSLDEWLTDIHLDLVGFTAYAQVAQLVEELNDQGVGEFARKVWVGEIDALTVADEMDRAIYAAIRSERMQAGGMQNFDPETRELMAAQFIDTGEDYRRAIEATIAETLLENRAKQLSPGQGYQLRSQLSRRRNAMSVRRLMSEYFPAVSAITPCFLMSPSSVAKFLPASNDLFDLVIFDEASQIRVPQAIGAMGRGKSVVIVGDSQQMPPSSMFMTKSDVSDDLEEDLEDQTVVPVDMESILSEAVESNFDRKMLVWHYRSRNESLIAFSNSRYYEDRLASFPSPPRITDAPQKAVSLVRVDGRWEGGAAAARVNKIEAEAIVDAVVEQLERAPEKSIGVITFNIQQRNLILDLLERRAGTSPALDEALTAQNAPLFVKNLENVQGDERDIIFFSLAFSPDEHGRIPLNWGPLSRSGGEKRLNVAVTRAKETVRVFTSFEPREFDLGASRSVGLKHLKEYLLQAQDAQFAQRSKLDEFTDLHHEEVYEALRKAGLQVRQRIGMSDFVLDLAVAVEGHRWLGILLEGPDWAERFSVSDREGLPRDVLINQMGWAGIRTVPLPHWIKDKDAVVAEIVKEAESLPLINDGDAAETEPVKRSSSPSVRPEERSVPSPEATAHTDSGSASVGTHTDVEDAGGPLTPPDLSERAAAPHLDDWTVPAAELELTSIRAAVTHHTHSAQPAVPQSSESETLRSPLPFIPADDTQRHEREILDRMPVGSVRLLREEALEIVEQEGPIAEDRLLTTLGRRFGLRRLQGKRREQLTRQLPTDLARVNVLGETFYWPAGIEPGDYTQFRERGERDTVDISFEELVNAMRLVYDQAPHLTEEEILSETRTTFDIGRLGAQIRPRFDRAYREIFGSH